MRSDLRSLFTIAMTIFFAAAVEAEGASGAIRLEEAYARALPPGQPNSAVFLRLTNEGASDRALVGAASRVCDVVELHTHRMEDGMMRMRRIDRIPLPAGETVALEPGGLHIMLIGLHEPLRAGDSVPLELVFDDGSRSHLDAPIRALVAHDGHRAPR